MELEIRKTIDGEEATIAPVGEIDSYTSPLFRSELRAVQEEHGPSLLVIDLDEVEFIDSTGLGVLIGALKQQKARRGELELRGLSETTEKLLALTGLDRIFTIENYERPLVAR